MAMQLDRLDSRIEELEMWNANENGFSFVISYESHSGDGRPGWVRGVVASDLSEQMRH